MKRSKLYVSFILASALVLPCYSSANADWLADEILKQLQEIRTEVKALRSEVADLHQQLDALQAGKAAVGSGAAEIKLADEPTLGESTAKVAIVEFSDFQCPFCTRHNNQTLPQIKDTYIKTGQVQYVMKDFPLDFHRLAKEAAVAANCAGTQGQFEPMRDALFDNPRSLGREFYMTKAKEFGLDEAVYTACLEDPAQTKEVEDDLAEGLALTVQGTPAFFVGRVENGVLKDATMISGAVPFERFKQVVDEYLN